MSNGNEKNLRKDFEDYALEAPRITVLNDMALLADETYRDTFNLNYRVGPIYDILRHPDTRMPMAIAIYGDWGTGKTSAMRWLDGLLQTWNKKGKDKDRIKVRAVWFYPWKYYSREDVWRGLVAEVIIRSIDVTEATVGTVTKAAKQFGIFLGRSFLHVLDGLKLKADVPGTKTGAELDLGSIKDIVAEYQAAAHPERAYLNEFAASLREWIQETIGKNERMVVFIDDLDRCMPDVALQVLEALKLYLNIDRLIFVLGVDRSVIDQLVAKHYAELGLDVEKSKNYLAKMFQVEVDLAPSEIQIENFLDAHLKSLDYWQQHLSEEEQDLFRKLILKMAERNPREVKRLINSALMWGGGVLVVGKE